MAISKTPVSGGYFADRDFINTKTSLNIALFSYFENLFFPEDPKRVIYASNDFAFRERMRINQKNTTTDNLLIQNMNLPFMNFYMTNLSPNTDRNWKSYPLELSGIMDWSIQKKIRMSPVKISYEATIFTEKETDLHYAMSQAFWQGALENIVKPSLQIDETEFSNIAVVKFQRNFSNQYKEQDWLEKNRIRAISLDFEVDSFLIKTNTEGFCIPQSVLFTFATTYDLDIHDWDDYDLLLTGVIDHLEGEVVF